MIGLGLSIFELAALASLAARGGGEGPPADTSVFAGGTWNDDGIWDDADIWNDEP